MFLRINAPVDALTATIRLAMVFAKYAIWSVPLTFVVGWLWGGPIIRRRVLQTGVTAVLTLPINISSSLTWCHPRSLATELGMNPSSHTPDSSFPSDHLTTLRTVASGLMQSTRLRRVGVLLALLGVSMARACIYPGVHYLLDMLGAAAVSALHAWLCSGYVVHTLSEPLHRLGLALYGVVLAPCVRRGQVHK